MAVPGFTLREVELAGKDPIFDLSTIDRNNVVADIEEIRRYNPQRFEMEQLTAIVYENMDDKFCVGYKDLANDEFWVRGHMPGMPLMPGVVMLEAAAQLSAYFTQKYDLLGSHMVGFGGLEDVRFREPVIPGDRLYLICEFLKARRNRMIISRFQGIVNDSIVVEGQLKGIPIPVDAVLRSNDDES
ncbi:MAG: 3-hydroxyacyl-[acyl-carrier-protein] dehydratase [Pirellulaceae bacterium]